MLVLYSLTTLSAHPIAKLLAVTETPELIKEITGMISLVFGLVLLISLRKRSEPWGWKIAFRQSLTFYPKPQPTSRMKSEQASQRAPRSTPQQIPHNQHPTSKPGMSHTTAPSATTAPTNLFPNLIAISCAIILIQILIGIFESNPLYSGQFVLKRCLIYLGPVVIEEMLFRGYLLRELFSWFCTRNPGRMLTSRTSASARSVNTRALNTASHLATSPLLAATLISSVCFALLHGVNISQDWMPTLLQISAGFCLGLIFCVLRVQTGSIWLAATIHLLINISSTTAIYYNYGSVLWLACVFIGAVISLRFLLRTEIDKGY